MVLCGLVGCQTKRTGGDDTLDGPSEGLYGPTVLRIEAPGGMTRLQNQQAILNAVAETRWEIREMAEGTETGLIQLYRKSYSFEALLTVRYDALVVEGYLESYGLSLDGRRENRRVPESWIDDLSRRIARNVELSAVGF